MWKILQPIRSHTSLHPQFISLTKISRNLRTLVKMASHTSQYDVIVIGSGQAGTPLSTAFAKAGHATALIERSHIGGCCINEGCTPTKTMIASGRVAHLARRASDYGVHSSGGGKIEVAVDMKRVRQRKRDIVESFRGGSEKRLTAAGVDVLMGEARFGGEKTVVVRMGDGSEREISGEKIIINVGERPAPPRLEGIEKIDKRRVLDSTSIQELDVVPEHLVVIGGGYVGVEFAQLMRRLGSEVTILQRGPQLLPREDGDVAECLLKILEEDGLKIHLQSAAVEILPTAGEKGIEVRFQNKGKKDVEKLAASHILFAAGRIPNTDTLSLPSAKVTTNAKGYVGCNEFLETSNPNVFVMGDAKGPPAFTHISYDDFRIIKANHLDATNTTKRLSTKNRLVPYVVYTDPQLGHIGLHHAEALAQFPGSRIQVASMPMAYVARALETDESRGMMKAVVSAESGLILGFTCLGMEGGEVMAVVQMAMAGGLRWEALRDAVWAHPSLAEALNNLWGFLE